MNNQPAWQALRCQAVHRTAEHVALGEGFGNPGTARACTVMRRIRSMMAADDVPLPGPAGAGRPALRSGVMPANRMNRDEFYAAMASHDDARLRKILWAVYWRGNAQLRERIEDELRPQDQPKIKPKKELPDPVGVLGEVTTFVELAKDGAYMAGDRRVHHTERSKWRYTFRRLAADALAALTASDPAPAQQAVAKIIDLACDMKRFDYFHSDDPVEAAKFVVSDAVAALWESVLRHDGFAALADRVPEQLIRWEADYGWTRRGYGQVAGKETLLVATCSLSSTDHATR